MSQFEQGHALIIGLANYQEERLRIGSKNTLNEAEGIAAALQAPEIGAYPDSQVHLVKDPTRAELIGALDDFAKQSRPAQTAVLHFSGHGILGEDGLYYFTTKDTILTSSAVAAKGTGVSAPEVLERLRTIQAQKLLVLINACFSGHIQPSLGPVDSLGATPSPKLGVEILATGEGRALISACRPSQKSYYNPTARYTYFGQALIDALHGQGIRQVSGYIGLNELYLSVYDRVKTILAGLGGLQEPMITLVQGVGRFPVALHTGGKLAALDASKLEPALLRGAVRSVPRRVVEVYKQSVIDFGTGNVIGNIKIGDVAGRDVIKIRIDQGGSAAAAAAGAGELLNLIGGLRDDVDRLTNLPEAVRDEVSGALDLARKAGSRGEKVRLLEKLETAEQVLLNTCDDSQPTRQLTEAIAAAQLRAQSLSFPTRTG